MSRPSPVDPAPLTPRCTAVAGSAMPGPASSTSSPSGETLTRNAAPSGVCEKTLPSIASTTRISSLRDNGTSTGTSPPTTSQRPLLVLGQHRPERQPVGEHLDQVGGLLPRASDAQPGAGDDRLELLVEQVAGLAHPLGDRAGRHRLGVQAQRGQRRTQSV